MCRFDILLMYVDDHLKVLVAVVELFLDHQHYKRIIERASPVTTVGCKLVWKG